MRTASALSSAALSSTVWPSTVLVGQPIVMTSTVTPLTPESAFCSSIDPARNSCSPGAWLGLPAMRTMRLLAPFRMWVPAMSVTAIRRGAIRVQRVCASVMKGLASDRQESATLLVGGRPMTVKSFLPRGVCREGGRVRGLLLRRLQRTAGGHHSREHGVHQSATVAADGDIGHQADLVLAEDRGHLHRGVTRGADGVDALAIRLGLGRTDGAD